MKAAGRLVFSLFLLVFIVGLGSAAELNVGSGETYTTIQAAIDAASSGDTINVRAGTYTETGQIVINKDLTIIGEDKNTVIIKPSSDTTLPMGGLNPPVESDGWFVIQNGISVDISGITFDGSGKNIAIGILSYGSGNIHDNIIENIKYGTYRGFGVMLWNSNIAITNNLFSNFQRIGVLMKGSSTNAIVSGNTFTCKGNGDWLDYAVELGAGAKANVVNNIISNCKGVASSDGSTSAGILVTTYYGGGTQATITGNTISDSTEGIAVGYNSSDTSVVVANNNNLIGNDDYGISSTAPLVNAKYNWWGSENPIFASMISGSVNYTPWLYKPIEELALRYNKANSCKHNNNSTICKL